MINYYMHKQKFVYLFPVCLLWFFEFKKRLFNSFTYLKHCNSTIRSTVGWKNLTTLPANLLWASDLCLNSALSDFHAFSNVLLITFRALLCISKRGGRREKESETERGRRERGGELLYPSSWSPSVDFDSLCKLLAYCSSMAALYHMTHSNTN